MVSWARLAVMLSSRPTPTTASPPVVAAALAGSTPPCGAAIVACTLSSTADRSSSEDGPTWNSTCAALPLSATIRLCRAGGATL